jgi:hypothetical protein
VSPKTPTSWAGRLPVSPAVLWTGIAIGVFLAVEAVVHGAVLPLSLGLLADAAITFGLIVAAAVVLAELARRHHRTVLRHGGRLSAASARRAGRHGRRILAWLAAKAGPRWANRDHQPLMFRTLRKHREPGDPGDPVPEGGASSGPSVVTGRPAAAGPDVTAATYVHGTPSPPTEGSTTMPASKISTGHRAQRAARTGTAGIPSEWAAVVGQTADFEPESDAELLDWMGRQVTGLSAWAEALVDTYEHCTQVIGIDPQASAMLHDVADAAAQAAETMGAAKAKFTQHYELPREFAANGGLMTHDGRWITGDGA